MIPEEITTDHLVKAIGRIDNEGFPNKNASDGYDVWYNGKLYPPKVVISYAYSFVSADGKDWPVNQFSSGVESFRFLTRRGFPIIWKQNKNPENCITLDDCWFFDAISNQPYDSENPFDASQGGYVSQQICGKNKRWADAIAATTDFERAGKKTWLEQQNSNRANQRFKYYTWYQLHHHSHFHEHIFYTVGFEGPHANYNEPTQLVIKLDCKRRFLSDKQKDAFDTLLRQKRVDWHYIAIPERKRFISWEELVNESVAFIEETFDTYLEAISVIEGVRPEMAGRIAWNDYDWTRPSGREGKSRSNADSHERQYGYCPEEWLFDIDKTIDGYHYARIEPLHTESGKHIGKIMNITLFSNHYNSRTWFWIGRIAQAEVIGEDLSAEITREYQNRGWISEQLVQLTALPEVDAENWRDWSPDDRFNIRFRPSQFVLYDLEPFASDETPPSGHYNLPFLKRPPAFLTQTLAELPDLGGLAGGIPEDSADIDIIRRAYKAEVRELEDVHRKVQRGFAKYLRQNYPNSSITVEVRKKVNRTRIDIVETLPDGSQIFYEVKTYPNVITSIRVAIGQLLEYAFYPAQILTKKLVIVSHLPATPRQLAFLDHLSRTIGVSFSYVFYDPETGSIG